MDYEKKYKNALTIAQSRFKIEKDESVLTCLGMMFPELRESEDERVRKSIVETIKQCTDILDPNNQKRMLDYLEKQKEQKPILEVFGFKVGDAVRLKDGDGRKHIIKSFEEVEGVHGPNFYHVEFEDNSARDGIYPGEEYPNGYYTQMEKFDEEQKPTATINGEPIPTENHSVDIPLAEWSEEDIKNFNRISAILLDASEVKCWWEKSRIIEKEEMNKLTEWLKLVFNSQSTRQQPKSEVTDEEIEEMVTKRSRSSGTTKSEMAFYRNGIKDAIKRFCLRPSWKPSEEQMKVLDEAFMKSDNEKYRQTISSLYYDLKNL